MLLYISEIKSVQNSFGDLCEISQFNSDSESSKSVALEKIVMEFVLKTDLDGILISSTVGGASIMVFVKIESNLLLLPTDVPFSNIIVSPLEVSLGEVTFR